MEQEFLVKQAKHCEPLIFWWCSECTFQNTNTQTACQMCGSVRVYIENQTQNPKYLEQVKIIKQKQKEGIKQKEIECVCGRLNGSCFQTCTSCGLNLSIFYQEQEIIKCELCYFENFKMNTNCLSCQKLLIGSNKHDSMQYQLCHICNEQVSIISYQQHASLCLIQKQYKNNSVKEDKQYLKYDRYNSMRFQNNRLTKNQGLALEYVFQNSKDSHFQSIQLLTKRIINLGYTVFDLEKALKYIEFDAPLIIHFSAKKDLNHFLKDTNYRNTFQVSGPSKYRIQKQSKLFGDVYQKAQPYERVKYGSINFTNDPTGNSYASSYGQSFLILSENVRKRCSFTCGNSQNESLVSTFKYPAKVLNQFNDIELRSLIAGSQGFQQASSNTRSYKQIQIHGPLQFSKDVSRLYLNLKQLQSQPTLLEKLNLFQQRFGVQYQLFTNNLLSNKY